MSQYERVHFRLYVMQCCGYALCWVNPRHPTYCPNCGNRCFPDVKAWATLIDDDATLELNVEGGDYD